MRVRVIVEKKNGVFDPEAKVIESTLLNLEHRVNKMCVKKVIEFTLEDTDSTNVEEKVTLMCEQLLVNPVLEKFRFEILE